VSHSFSRASTLDPKGALLMSLSKSAEGRWAVRVSPNTIQPAFNKLVPEWAWLLQQRHFYKGILVAGLSRGKAGRVSPGLLPLSSRSPTIG